ncbi:hypothetical protein RFI_10152 [Reticulomyxa filosa]|uniref:Uncharacterized protein n=1 Tax=Reticulomyxa filosa TaxID=46433 RepID=X6NMS0_RETFI|nr:hypothetical protein RFI_10152 [Reticulomyxa filosa]|eukprot:ETO26979.1 hypothetical protein RFI_10152 [Reticulomyxa filosa]
MKDNGPQTRDKNNTKCLDDAKRHKSTSLIDHEYENEPVAVDNEMDHLQEHSFAVMEGENHSPDSEIGSFIKMCQQAPRLQLFNTMDPYLAPVHDHNQNDFYSGIFIIVCISPSLPIFF